MRKWALKAVIVTAFIGVVLSSVSLSQYLRIQRNGLEQQSFCAINEKINCDIFNASSYSTSLGVPNAGLGIIFYLVIVGMSAYAAMSLKKRESTAVFAWLMSLAGIFYSAYLACISFFVLDVLCAECLGTCVVNIALFVLLLVASPVLTRGFAEFAANYIKGIFLKRDGAEFRPHFFYHLAVVAAVTLTGWLILTNVQAKNSNIKGDMDVDELVKFFYLQSPYNVDVKQEWPVWGNPDASVTIVEFSEYQCPFCRLAAFGVKPYLYEFKDDVRYYFVNYPLDTACNEKLDHQMHPIACYMAKAGICAGGKGDFWGFHDEAFRNQRNLSRKLVQELVKKRGWDVAEFEACIDSSITEKRVKDDIAAGEKLGVTGIPMIFLNGRKLRYWRSPDFVRKTVKEEIKKSGRKNGATADSGG